MYSTITSILLESSLNLLFGEALVFIDFKMLQGLLGGEEV